MSLLTELSYPVFLSKFDHRYDVKVLRKGSYEGILQVWDNGTLLMEKDVTLSYGAVFGPDVADVAEWEKLVANFVDNR